MLGDIKEIVDSNVFVNLSIDISKQTNLVDLHIIFEDGPAKVVGQIVSTTRTVLKANIVGEIKDNIFLPLVPHNKARKSPKQVLPNTYICVGPPHQFHKKQGF